jgi:glutamyl-tRNA reductase
MNFYLIGIDHRKAPISIREAVYWKRAEVAGFLAKLPAGRAAILSTCSRFEIYGVTKDPFNAGVIVDLLKDKFRPLFNNTYTIYSQEKVLKHLVRLAAGLESQIRGELQIYSQLGAWAGQDNFPPKIAGLVHDALLAAHDVRMKNGLNKPDNNIAVFVYEKILSEIHPNKLLNIAVVGTGKIAELFAAYKPQGVRLYFAAHKNISKAEGLAHKAQGKALFLKELPEYLKTADVLISATASPHRVFDKNYFLKIAVSRKQELYIYDLALPRDVAPGVKDIDGIILKNIDEVFINVDLKNRHKAESFSR